MRAHASRQGLTLVELMVASSIATALGGAMLVLTNAISQSYTTQLALGELSGYLDAATEQLKRDIWTATAATAQPGDGVCANNNSWLILTRPTPPNTIRYCFDASDAQNILLRRTEDNANARFVAHHVIPFDPDPAPDTTVTVSGTLVTLNIRTRKTVLGRQFERGITNVSYRFQQ